MNRARDERGVAAVMVALSLTAIFAALLLTLDAGNLWQTRRNIVTATDAAALQAAHKAALTGTATACNSWTTILNSNTNNSVSPGACTVTRVTSSSGYVTITASKSSKVVFGGPLGVGDTSAYSMSTAEWGNLTSVLDARPIGLCSQESSVQQWLGTGTSTDVQPSPGVYRIPFDKIAGACGTAPGNWGFIDFNGGSNSNSDLKDWLENGYSSQVAPNDCNADGVLGDYCNADTGSSGGSISPSLDYLVSSAHPFALVIYDTATGNGSGVQYKVNSFVGVILRGYKLNGGGGNKSDYLDLEFTNLIWRGGCCTSSGTNTGLHGIKLCSADHDPVAVATRCS